jgi:glycyl-tRNA synthetase beta chain
MTSVKQTGKSAKSETLLVELLTEELPPKALRSLSEAFAKALAEDLRQDSFLEPDSAVEPYGTPRRLALRITRVRDRAPDRLVESSGPSVKAGLDAKGQPTPALLGFAKKHGVEVGKLARRQTPKGEFFFYTTTAKGGQLDANLALKVAAALEVLPIPKVMRWGSGDQQFARPVHGLVMLHGAREISGTVLGLESSNRTRGHRFLSGSGIVLRHADEYERALREQGKVIADFSARRTLVIKALEEAAGRGAALVADDALLDEITALVEWPAVYAGEFSRDFLDVPEECLVLAMQRHQKYVPLRDQATGRLLPRFLFVSNLETKQPREIIHGNERVLRARLADAKFFYDQDRKTRLEARVPRLASVVYHGKLGSQLERVERIQLLAGKIAHGIGADPLLTGRAAWLSKADLLTDMVGEFPELQGTMGRYYAIHDGEPHAAADAIEAHYRPRYAGDALPDNPVGIAVALADKLDALAGLFGIGQTPTGDRDPFGLRRAALGVVRILVERRLTLPLNDLVAAAIKEFGGRVSDAQAALESFIYDRLAGYLKDAGYTTLEVDSVVSLRPGRIDLTPRQLEAVRAFNRLPEAESLAAANKRVANILKQAAAKGETFASAESDKLKEPAERELYSALAITADSARSLYERGDFTGFLKTFAALKGPVDAFFDSVMVMVDDHELRQNRLALLADLRAEMNRVADLSKLAA